MTDYEPGTVAYITFESDNHWAGHEGRALLTAGDSGAKGYWEFANSACLANNLASFASAEVKEVRPLAVIDPEDDDQVKRFMHLLGLQSDPPYGSRLSELRTALREIADPTPTCAAAVNINGERYGCVEPAGHAGGHRNPDAQAVWVSAEGARDA